MLSIKTEFSKKQLSKIMEQYTLKLLQPRLFTDLPVKFAYESSQFGSTVSCHLRTTQGVVKEVGDLVEWFEDLPEEEQERILT